MVIKEVLTHITHMMYERKEGSFSVSHIWQEVCLSLAFNHERYASMPKNCQITGEGLRRDIQ